MKHTENTTTIEDVPRKPYQPDCSDSAEIKEIRDALVIARESNLEAEVVWSFIGYYHNHKTLNTDMLWEAALSDWDLKK